MEIRRPEGANGYWELTGWFAKANSVFSLKEKNPPLITDRLNTEPKNSSLIKNQTRRQKRHLTAANAPG